MTYEHNTNPITNTLLSNYFKQLINKFFKILPMREKQEVSLAIYMQSLKAELSGCKELSASVRENPLYLTLLATLQYLIDNQECPIGELKREVFKTISICKKLERDFAESEVLK